MPVYQLRCPDCGHEFSGMVFMGTRPPAVWICAQCGGERARPREDCLPTPHPLEATHGSGCPCCGGDAVSGQH